MTNPVRDMRLFESDFCELFSKTPWWGVPIVHCTNMLILAKYCNDDLLANLFWVSAGCFLWTFTEYTLHRFLFHGEDTWMAQLPPWPMLLTGHFLLHGQHHCFPSDKMRLVFPPLPACVLAYFVIGPTLSKFVDDAAWYPIMIGMFAGYQAYDLLHYYFHHGNPTLEFLKDLKAYHMFHHHKDGSAGYGVSNKLWDYVFGTVLDMRKSRHFAS